MSLRIPAYCRDAHVRVNCKDVGDITAGEYLHLARTWENGDVIEVDLDMPARVFRGAPLEDDPASEHHTAIQGGALVLARDARVSEGVGTPILLKTDAEGNAILHPVDMPEFPVQCAYDVETEDGMIRMIDYASAGKTWDTDSLTECWMPTKD